MRAVNMSTPAKRAQGAWRGDTGVATSERLFEEEDLHLVRPQPAETRCPALP